MLLPVVASKAPEAQNTAPVPATQVAANERFLRRFGVTHPELNRRERRRIAALLRKAR